MPDADVLPPHADAAARSGNSLARAQREGSRTLELSITSDLAALEQEWRQFEAHADCTPFQSFDWLSTWQRQIGTLSGTVPALVVARRGGETMMILPLAVTRKASGRQLTFLGRDLGDYNAPLLAFDFGKRCGDFKELWRTIRALLQGDPRLAHDVILLDKMPATIGAQANPFLQLETNLHPSSAYIARLTEDWEAFYEAKRSSGTRKGDRNKRKRLAEHGEVRFVTPLTSADVALAAETLIAQKVRSFERMGVPDIFARPGYRAFFLDITTNPRARSFAHVSKLDVGGVAAATNLGLCFRGTYYHVLASYDDGPLARFGPGTAHLHELMRYAIERGCTQFDFTVGDEPYKRDWCDLEMKLYDYVAAASPRGFVTANALAVFRKAKRAIKRSPRIWPALLKARATLGALKRRVGRG